MANGTTSQTWLELLQDRIYDMVGYSPTSYMDLANLTPEMISGGFQSKYNLGASDVPPGLFQPFDIEKLTSVTHKPYSPQINLAGSNVDLGLLKKAESKAYRTASGGFAGSGAAGSFTDLLRNIKEQEMIDPLKEREKSVSSGKQLVDEQLNQWQQILAELTAGA